MTFYTWVTDDIMRAVDANYLFGHSNQASARTLMQMGTTVATTAANGSISLSWNAFPTATDVVVATPGDTANDEVQVQIEASGQTTSGCTVYVMRRKGGGGIEALPSLSCRVDWIVLGH